MPPIQLRKHYPRPLACRSLDRFARHFFDTEHPRRGGVCFAIAAGHWEASRGLVPRWRPRSIATPRLPTWDQSSDRRHGLAGSARSTLSN